MVDGTFGWLMMFIISSQCNTCFLRTVPCRCSGQNKWHVIQLQKIKFPENNLHKTRVATWLHWYTLSTLIFQQPLYGWKTPKKKDKWKLRYIENSSPCKALNFPWDLHIASPSWVVLVLSYLYGDSLSKMWPLDICWKSHSFLSRVNYILQIKLLSQRLCLSN